MAMRPVKRLEVNARYLVALAGRFRRTLLLTAGLFGVVPAFYVVLYRGPAGERIDYGEALHHVYFLLFGQPSLPYVDNFPIEALNLAIPPFGVAVILDGIVRFVLLALARERSDKEWIAVLTRSFDNHAVVCGAGRIGYRVATQLAGLGKDVVVIEKNEQASFVSVLRDMQIPVLIDDIRSRQCLERTNIARASVIVAATDDDLANLNVALDARRVKPDIRVVIRLFDDDLASTVRETFGAEAMSTSAVAAPAMALAAIDPRIVHSFRVGEHLMVVSQFRVHGPLCGLEVAELRDQYGCLTLSAKDAAGREAIHPHGGRKLVLGDEITVQARYEEYSALRALLGEADPPVPKRLVG